VDPVFGFPERYGSDILSLIPSAVHVHPDTNMFPEHDCSGTQSTDEIRRWAEAIGFDSVWLTPHATNPGAGKPHELDEQSSQVQALLSFIRGVRRDRADLGSGVALYGGIEDNILRHGGLCSPVSVLKAADMVIGSIHGVVPGTASEVMSTFMGVSDNPYVDVVGHMQRYLEHVEGIDWRILFGAMASRGKLVEANFNASFTYGYFKLRKRANSLADWRKVREAEEREREFYFAMGRSGVQVVVTLDIHNAGMVPTSRPVADWQPTIRDLYEFLSLVIDAGVAESDIVNDRLEQICLDRRSSIE
jgi:histidinol phosphatase-like PHP family hydrolase